MSKHAQFLVFRMVRHPNLHAIGSVPRFSVLRWTWVKTVIYGLPSVHPRICQTLALNLAASVGLLAGIIVWALPKVSCAMSAVLPLTHGISFLLRMPIVLIF